MNNNQTSDTRGKAVMPQAWFEMKDVRRRQLNSAVWIPLRASQVLTETGQIGHQGYKYEFFGAGSIAVGTGTMEKAKGVGWSEIGISRTHGFTFEDNRYVPADVVCLQGFNFEALALVLHQEGNGDDPPEWHLHPDFVIALRLKREGDLWLAPDEGYIEVARLDRHDGRPVLLKVRAEHLRDYLCARGMALRIATYRSREHTVADASSIPWPENPYCQASDTNRWEGRVQEMHEGGFGIGSSAAVLRMTREDVDNDEDVPQIGPSDENIASQAWTVQRDGERVFRVQGDLWRDEWILPAEQSPRIRGDKLPPSVSFITDAAGTRVPPLELKDEGRWLWFRPEVMMALLQPRGASLKWYTRDTGGIKCGPGSYVHFGVNTLGFVNVYAKDIAYLPEWQQKVWAGFNISPEGGVSAELLAAQAEGC